MGRARPAKAVFDVFLLREGLEGGYQGGARERKGNDVILFQLKRKSFFFNLRAIIYMYMSQRLIHS